MMVVPELLLEVLEDLINDDFKTFKFYLSIRVLEGCKPIPKYYLENASRIETVSLVTDRYGEETAVDVTVEILHKMGQNNAAKRLKQQRSSAGAGMFQTRRRPNHGFYNVIFGLF